MPKISLICRRWFDVVCAAAHSAHSRLLLAAVSPRNILFIAWYNAGRYYDHNQSRPVSCWNRHSRVETRMHDGRCPGCRSTTTAPVRNQTRGVMGSGPNMTASTRSVIVSRSHELDCCAFFVLSFPGTWRSLVLVERVIKLQFCGHFVRLHSVLS